MIPVASRKAIPLHHGCQDEIGGGWSLMIDALWIKQIQTLLGPFALAGLLPRLGDQHRMLAEPPQRIRGSAFVSARPDAVSSGCNMTLGHGHPRARKIGERWEDEDIISRGTCRKWPRWPRFVKGPDWVPRPAPKPEKRQALGYAVAEEQS